MRNVLELPVGLPVPQDDGACDHLVGTPIPELLLASTAGYPIDLAQLGGRTVVYCYPRTGQPDQPIPGEWDAIPGARGCTPQSCAFRDLFRELTGDGASH
jgi:peroxiredoxin